MHNLVMAALYLSFPVSGMLFYLVGFRPWHRRVVYSDGQKVCPVCRRPM